jgi:hypothetical protein
MIINSQTLIDESGFVPSSILTDKCPFVSDSAKDEKSRYGRRKKRDQSLKTVIGKPKLCRSPFEKSDAI